MRITMRRLIVTLVVGAVAAALVWSRRTATDLC